MNGLKDSDLAAEKLTDDAIRWSALEQTIKEVGTKFADLSPEALQQIIDEAVAAARRSQANKP